MRSVLRPDSSSVAATALPKASVTLGRTRIVSPAPTVEPDAWIVSSWTIASVAAFSPLRPDFSSSASPKEKPSIDEPDACATFGLHRILYGEPGSATRFAAAMAAALAAAAAAASSTMLARRPPSLEKLPSALGSSSFEVRRPWPPSGGGASTSGGGSVSRHHRCRSKLPARSGVKPRL